MNSSIKREEVISKIKKAFDIKRAELSISSSRVEFDNLYKKIFPTGKKEKVVKKSDSFNGKFIRLKKFGSYLKLNEIVLMGKYLNVSLIDDFSEIAELEIKERKQELSKDKINNAK